MIAICAPIRETFVSNPRSYGSNNDRDPRPEGTPGGEANPDHHPDTSAQCHYAKSRRKAKEKETRKADEPMGDKEE